MFEIFTQKRFNIKILLIYFFFIVLMVLTISRKTNLYVDEIFSYGLANHMNNGSGILPEIEDGETYSPSNTPWIEYMTVNAENRFHYANVWVNQEQDVHPPFYYLILHTVCSFFPNSFSIWFAGLINIVFALGTLYFLRKIVLIMTEDGMVLTVISLGFVCCTGVLSAVSFLRMYLVAMFWVTALAYVLVRQTGQRHTIKFYGELLLCTVGGALTHYYCIVYTVFISTVYGLYMLSRRRLKETGFFCLVQGIAGILSVSIFPGMVNHIFSSGRGKQSVENMSEVSASVWGKRVNIYLSLVDKQLFGGIFLYIVSTGFLLLFLWIVYGRLQKKEDEKREILIMRYLILIIPAVLYFILISKISVYLTTRYMYPIYGVLFVVVSCGIFKWIQGVAGKHTVPRLILMVSDNDEEIISRVRGICPELTGCEHLGGYGYTNTYYLFSDL